MKRFKNTFLSADTEALYDEGYEVRDVRLNNYIFQYGTVNLMVGATSVGKTELALDFLIDHLKFGTSIYIAFEGTRHELVNRFSRKFSSGEEFKKTLKKFVWMLNPDINEIKEVLSKIPGKRFICLDYLQQFARRLSLIKNERSMVLVNHIVELFSTFREDENTVILLLSNMTKASINEMAREKSLNPLILLGSIKESGDVAYDCDSVFALAYRDDAGNVYLGRNNGKFVRNLAVLLTLKNFRITGKLGNNEQRVNYIFNPMNHSFESER